VRRARDLRASEVTELPREMNNGIFAWMHAGDINRIVIVGLARTPTGGFQGELKGFAAPDLGAAAIGAEVEMRPEEVDELIMGVKNRIV